MPRAASIEVNAHLLPPLVPRTLRRRSHASVFGGFNMRLDREMGFPESMGVEIRPRLNGR